MEERQTQLALASCQQAMEQAGSAVFVLDLQRRTQVCTCGAPNWLGGARQLYQLPEGLLAGGAVHADDGPRVRDFYARLFAGAAARCRVRVHSEPQGLLWLEFQGWPMQGAPGKAVILQRDVTEYRRIQMRHQHYRDTVAADASFVWEANLTLDTLLADAHEGGQGAQQPVAPSYRQAYQGMLQQVLPEHRARVAQALEPQRLLAAFGQGRRQFSAEYPMLFTRDGQVHWLRTKITLGHNLQGQVVGIVCSWDVTHRRQREEALRAQAERDPLCWLFNRHTFEQRVAAALADPAQAGPHALLMLDVDDFKTINDRYGHMLGDALLRGIAQTLGATFRKSDILGRMGGDEFVVFMPAVGSLETVLERAAHIQRALEKACGQLGAACAPTLSIGVAMARPGDGFAQLYARADQALYQAKAQGKCCCRVWQPPQGAAPAERLG